MNRLVAARIVIEKAIAEMSEENRAGAQIEAARLTVEELTQFQDVRVLFRRNRLITAEESEWLDNVLGADDPTVEKWCAQSLVDRVLALSIFVSHSEAVTDTVAVGAR